MIEAALARQIDETLGPVDFSDARYEKLERLADRMTRAHWHAGDLPWEQRPLLPLPPGDLAHRAHSFVEFGKRAIAVQLAAEHVAVTAAHFLAKYADAHAMHASVRRALAAVLNDEASHAAVMLELQVRTDRSYPGVVAPASPVPLFEVFVDAIPRLDPALVAIFMGAYEAMIAIRGYAEEAAYRYPSILGWIAELGAKDDAHHAKVMRLVGHILLDDLRSRASDPAERTALMRDCIVEPMRRFWSLVIEHERLLLRGEPRLHKVWRRRVMTDAAIIDHLFIGLGLTPDERASVALLETARTACGPDGAR